MLEPGQQFAGRYRIIRQIAEGGMGAIFEAEHTATERRVALKILFPHIMSVASARSKFELEAKISARVNSPYIVEVLDAGFDETSKSPYLVMELLEGQTIADFVEQRGPLGIDEVLPLLQQVADGLDAAHGYKESNGTPKAIVHRDLKPENLFMARERGAVVVKILDFGIAKVLGETSNTSQEVRGTPLYMAVEQIMAGALSPQTDVWALGLIAYYMLTASSYWRSANLESAGMQSLFAEILSLPIEAPSQRIRQYEVKATLPPAFDAWLLRCLDREPSRRFASAGLAVDELARAYARTPRARAHPSARPAPGALTSSEAFAAPVPAPHRFESTRAATLGSLPGMASEHSARPVLPAPRRAPWIATASVGLLALMGAVGWLVASHSRTVTAAAGPSHEPIRAALAAAAPSVAVATASPASNPTAPSNAPASAQSFASTPAVPSNAPASAPSPVAEGQPAPSAAPAASEGIAALEPPTKPSSGERTAPVRASAHKPSVPTARKPSASPRKASSAVDAYRMR